MIGYSSNLTIIISNTTTGTYTCHVSVTGYDGIEASAHVYQHGPPRIVKSEERLEQYWSPGGVVELVCEAVSVPLADTMVWTHNDKLVMENIVTHTLENSVVSSIAVQDTRSGVYNCSASNKYGQDYAVIHLHRADYPPVLVVCLVSACVVLLTAILVITQWRKLTLQRTDTRQGKERWTHATHITTEDDGSWSKVRSINSMVKHMIISLKFMPISQT